MAQALPPGEAPSLDSVLLKTLKADCPPDGRDERTTWGEHTTWTITRDRRHGSVLLRTTMQASSVLSWNSRPTLSAPGTRTACFLKIALEQTHQHCQTERMLRLLHTHLQLLPRRIMPAPRRWWQQALLPPELESCQLAGSNAIHRRDVPTS